MDRTMEALTHFTCATTYKGLPTNAVPMAVRRYLDSVGCAAGGFASESCRIARELAESATSVNGISAFGIKDRSTPEYAIFANSCATRYLDFNDGYVGCATGGGVHPSDMAPAIVGAVEMVGGSGRDVVLAMYIGYEVAATIADEVPLRARGWDQGANISIATAAAVGKVFGLDAQTLSNAIALAITPSIPLHVTRAGELSHWKGCAAPHAAATAMWAVRLAKAGMTGPSRPFEGLHGYGENVFPLRLAQLAKPLDGRIGLERAFTKPLPAEAHSLASVEEFLRLSTEIDVNEIESVQIRTYHMKWHEIGGGAEDAEQKWDPQTRETADHSLPYLVAVALMDRKVTVDSFTPERIKDPALRPLMQKIAVSVDDAFEKRFQNGEMVSGIMVALKNGAVIEREVNTFRGKPETPMSDDDLDAKFMTMIPQVLVTEDAEQLKKRLWSLDDLPRLDDVTGMYRKWKII